MTLAEQYALTVKAVEALYSLQCALLNGSAPDFDRMDLDTGVCPTRLADGSLLTL